MIKLSYGIIYLKKWIILMRNKRGILTSIKEAKYNKINICNHDQSNAIYSNWNLFN